VVQKNNMEKEIIYTENAPAPIGPYSQAVRAGNFVFCSGQIALDAKSGELVNENIQAETTQVMKNIIALLDAVNATTDNIVKTTIFLSDMSLFAAVNEVYGSYFTNDAPARETVAVKGLPKNVNVEISVTVYL
jgi:2-iminobutanoate/2-iminopropanoate deaminase